MGLGYFYSKTIVNINFTYYFILHFLKAELTRGFSVGDLVAVTISVFSAFRSTQDFLDRKIFAALQAAFSSNKTHFNVFTSLLSAAGENFGVYTPFRMILPWKMMIPFTNNREFLPRIFLNTLSSNASTQDFLKNPG